MLSQLAEWKRWLIAHGRAALTVFGYGWEIERLAAWGQTQTPPLLIPEDFLETHLIQYLAERRLANAADSTVKRCSSAFRVFFRWLFGPNSPAEKLPLPRRVRRVRPRRWFTQVRTDEILSGFDTSTPIGKRDAALFSLMLASGLRAAEVCRLRTNDVDLNNLVLFVKVKGGQVAAVFFTEDVAALIYNWLTVRPEVAREGVETLFVGLGGPKPGTPITPSGLRKIFQYIGERHGTKLAPHDLRRTGAAQFINNGGSTRQLKTLWRIKRDEEVQTYTEWIDLEAARRFLPRPSKR